MDEGKGWTGGRKVEEHGVSSFKKENVFHYWEIYFLPFGELLSPFTNQTKESGETTSLRKYFRLIKHFLHNYYSWTEETCSFNIFFQLLWCKGLFYIG